MPPALPFCRRVEEGFTIPLRPALRSTAFGEDRPGLASEAPPFLREGGRGVHGPAPASASVYRLRRADCPPRDREPLFTLAWLGATDRSPGYRGGEGRVFPSSPHGPLSLGGADAHPTHPQKPLSMGATMSGSTEPSWRGVAVVLRRGRSYGEAEQRAYLPTCQSPPKPGRAVFGSLSLPPARKGAATPAQGPPTPSSPRSDRSRGHPKAC